jgi:hypothetical protein
MPGDGDGLSRRLGRLRPCDAGRQAQLGPEPRSQRAGGGPDEPRTPVSEGNEKGEMESSRQVRKRETKNESIKKKRDCGVYATLVRVVRGPRNACWQ